MAAKKKSKKVARRRVKSAQSQLQATTRAVRRRKSSPRVTLANAVERMPKMPRLKKRAKKPRIGASLAVWRRYEARQEAIDAENERRLKPYFAKVKAYRATLAEKRNIAEQAGSHVSTVAQKLKELGVG